MRQHEVPRGRDEALEPQRHEEGDEDESRLLRGESEAPLGVAVLAAGVELEQVERRGQQRAEPQEAVHEGRGAQGGHVHDALARQLDAHHRPLDGVPVLAGAAGHDRRHDEHEGP